MSYTLYGSRTSPFVRRIRMLMENLPHEFNEMKVFEKEDAARLNKINPLNQIPVLTDEEITVWDSRQIFNYLNHKHSLFETNWKDENFLTAIEGAMNSGVSLILMKRSGMDIDGPYMFVDRQKERIESVLDYLRPFIEAQSHDDWNFQSMTLYSFLDWALFRNIISLEKRPECLNMLDAHKKRSIVTLTEIPRT